MRFFRKTIYFIAIFCMAILGCEEETFEKPEIVIIDLEATDCSSYGSADGAVQSSIIGGIPPFLYVWSNGATTESISGVKAGRYTLKVIYGNSGIAESSVEVSEPAGTLSLNITVEDAGWYGGDDGGISIVVTDGVAPYSYTWAHDEEVTGPTISGLTAGLYQVAITDSGPKPVTIIKVITVGQPEFVCGQDSITDVDGYKYPTVQIGGQCWTALNLVTKHNPNNPEELIDGRFCKGTNCLSEFGAHYTWEAAMNGHMTAAANERVQGICPKGWHIPSRDEWKTFNSWLSIDGNGGAGVNVPNKIRGEGSSSGYDALYAGNWGYDVYTGELAAFWSSTRNDNQAGRSYYRLVNNFPLLGEGHEDTRVGMSCRCIEDE